MRKLAWILAAAVLTPAFPSATVAQRGLSIGARTGLSTARVHGADAEQVDARTAFTGGASASLGLSDRLALEIDVLYAPKGGTMTGSSFNGTITYRFNYIEVPVLVRYTVLPRARLRPALVLGIARAVRLNSSSTNASFTGFAYPRQFVFPKTTDNGLVFGATVGAPVGRHQVRLDARYTLGLTHLAGTQFTNSGTVNDPNIDLKNGTLTLTMGYAFNVAPRLFTRAP